MLSKSKFLLGKQCQKAFWLKHTGVPETNPKDASAQSLISAGNEVGEIAKELFPGGVEIEYINYEYEKMSELTLQAIKDGVESLYEASFLKNGNFIRVDLMNKTSQGWDVYEVKSSAKLKPSHKEDLSFQWHVLKTIPEIELNDAYVITLDGDYIKNGKTNPGELFKKYLLTDEINLKQPQIKDEIRDISLIPEFSEAPKIKIGTHCNNPHACAYLDKCFPENIKDKDSIFTLNNLPMTDKIALLDKGIDTFDKIDKSTLKPIQQNQITAFQNNSPLVNIDKLKNFINEVKYPISYFDFETFTDVVPIFDGQKPYMQMPCQYSLHIQKNADDKMSANDSHHEFIADHDIDPRRAIAKSMIRNLPTSGSIMAYNISFEKACIITLAEHCPDLASELLLLNERLMDLIVPFKGGGYYHSDFRGSFSIKSVLPALCPEEDKNYKELAISEGGSAALVYKNMRGKSQEEVKISREELFKYCSVDSYAMFALYQKLLIIVKEREKNWI